MLSSLWGNVLGGNRSQRPLQGQKAFRLLQLIPDVKQPHGFWISLQNYDLDKVPPFEVLSYTRGPKYFDEMVNEWEEKSHCKEMRAYRSPHSPQHPPSTGSDETDTVVGRLTNMIFNATPVDGKNAVQVNGLHMPIPEDVLDFLKYAHSQKWYWPTNLLRQNGVEKGDVKYEEKYLWIDAVCINQQDVAERNAQAHMLGQIYKASLRTLVWFSAHGAPEIVDWVLTDFAPRCLALQGEHGSDFIWAEDSLGKGAEMKEALGEEDARLWPGALMHLWTLLARHQYFIEGWVQEVLLSPKAEVVFGNKLWDWALLERFVVLTAPSVRALNRDHLSQSCPKLGPFWARNVLWSMRACNSIRTKWLEPARQASRGPETIHHDIAAMAMLLKARRFEDKCDNIYGWLAMTSLLVPQGKRFGKVDYSLPCEAVYTRFTRSLVQGMRNLDMLNYVEGFEFKKRHDWLPSWVPDFSATQMPLTLLDYEPSVAFDATYTLLQGGTSAATQIGFEQSTLVATGVRIDTIRSRANGCIVHKPEYAKYPVEWMLEKCIEIEKQQRGGNLAQGREGRTPLEALCWTLAFGSLVIKAGESTTPQEVFYVFLASLLSNHRRGLSGTQDDKLFGLLRELTVQIQETEACGTCMSTDSRRPRLPYTKVELRTAAAEHESAVKYSMELGQRSRKMRNYRALFATREGRWGWSHLATKASDEIWLLDGGRTPYVLRRVEGVSKMPMGETYRLIGEAYVEGFMFGEGLTAELLGGRRPVRIV